MENKEFNKDEFVGLTIPRSSFQYESKEAAGLLVMDKVVWISKKFIKTNEVTLSAYVSFGVKSFYFIAKSDEKIEGSSLIELCKVAFKDFQYIK